jgi:hypothetical protein
MRCTMIAFLLLAAIPLPAASQGSSSSLLQRCPKEKEEKAKCQAPEKPEVGEVVTMTPKLWWVRPRPAEPDCPSETEMAKCSKVFPGMRVNTRDEGGAWIAIKAEAEKLSKEAEKPSKKGFVILGPETEVVFTEFVIETARGNRPRMSLLMQLGQFRVGLAPSSDELGEGEYWIVVPASGVRPETRIRMSGTDIYVAADARSTTVAVFEGSVSVESAGRTVKLTAGTWTRATANERPLVPVIFNPEAEKLDPSSGGLPKVPDEMFPVEPPFPFDDPRLNLPK